MKIAEGGRHGGCHPGNAPGVFAKLAEPVDFAAIDERPRDLMFMLLAPSEARAEHLRTLARVSRAFRQEAPKQDRV